MIEASVDVPGNLLKVCYRGTIGPEETRRWLPQMESMIRQMQPGFRLLSDLSGLDMMDLGCVPHIEQIMDLCDDRGIAMVVRVIPDPHKDIGLNIMSLFHYQRRVRIVTCETIEEAQAALSR
jgi:hypothetical protein